MSSTSRYEKLNQDQSLTTENILSFVTKGEFQKDTLLCKNRLWIYFQSKNLCPVKNFKNFTEKGNIMLIHPSSNRFLKSYINLEETDLFAFSVIS